MAFISGKSSPCQMYSEKGFDFVCAAAASMLLMSIRWNASRRTQVMSSIVGSGGSGHESRRKRASASKTSRSNGQRTRSCKHGKGKMSTTSLLSLTYSRADLLTRQCYCRDGELALSGTAAENV